MGVEGLEKLAFDFTEIFKVVIPNAHAAVVKKIALEAFSGMVMKTPVDTGRARANWSVSIGKASGSTREAFDKQPFGMAPGAQQAQATATANGAKNGATIYVTNSLPYILPLEEGHSKQGAHMVELTVQEIKSHYGV
jgi:hypothetical protein